MTQKIYRVLFSLMLGVSSLSSALTLNDTGQINATDVFRVIKVQSEADILAAIQSANLQHIPIAIMGVQHSQGGQSLAPNAIILNMVKFNRVLALDRKKKQVTVQSGIIWGDLQKYINQFNLAVKSMQSPNIFTVGGSISVNAHGDDFRAGAVGNSLLAFHMITATGKKLLVTRQTNPNLWAAVIGGYGLLGVITDVTLQLTDNSYLTSNYVTTDMTNFGAFFREKILKDKPITLFYTHLNIVPDVNFLKTAYTITYKNTDQIPDKVIGLDNPDQWNVILTPLFNMSRHGKLGKQWRWNLENKIFSKFYAHRLVTRNNAMEKPVKFATNYHSKYNADWLQEYFIPIDKLPQFIAVLRDTMIKYAVNLLNVTIRYTPAEKNFWLTYANRDCFAIVIYFNQDLSAPEIAQAQTWTRKLINAALLLNGNYYLPYQPFATRSQFQQGYAEYQRFLKIKNTYDPHGLFINKFYLNYLK